jgi:hypothetical protein
MNTSKLTGVIILLVAAALVVLNGCATMDSAYEKTVSVTDPDKTRLSTELTWLNPQPRIRPVSSDKMFVYCRVKNSSGSDIELRDAIQDEIEELGYRLTRDIDEAQFTIMADLRHFGEGSETSSTPLIAGAVIGGVGGGVIGHNVGTGNTGTGAVAGAVAGAVIGDIVAKRNKIRTINLIVDITIGERIGKKVSTKRGSEEESYVEHAGDISAGAGLESGHSSSGSSDSQSVALEEDFLYHSNRATSSATRMNLTLDQAEGPLVRKLSQAVANALP